MNKPISKKLDCQCSEVTGQYCDAKKMNAKDGTYFWFVSECHRETVDACGTDTGLRKKIWITTYCQDVVPKDDENDHQYFYAYCNTGETK